MVLDDGLSRRSELKPVGSRPSGSAPAATAAGGATATGQPRRDAGGALARSGVPALADSAVARGMAGGVSKARLPQARTGFKPPAVSELPIVRARLSPAHHQHRPHRASPPDAGRRAGPHAPSGHAAVHHARKASVNHTQRVDHLPS